MRRETFGERIERLRKLSGLSARELATLAGLQQSHVRFLEILEREQVSAQTVRRIAKVFGVSGDWLFAGDGEVPTDAEIIAAVERARSAVGRTGT